MKTFDSAGKTGLWHLLRKYGCPQKFTTMIESLHIGMMVNVRNGVEVSDTFAITNWDYAAMLEDTFRDMRNGVNIQDEPDSLLWKTSSSERISAGHDILRMPTDGLSM